MRSILFSVLLVGGWVICAAGQGDNSLASFTNTAQFAQQFGRTDLLWIPLGPADWEAFPLDGQPFWWADFEQLPVQFGACYAASTLESSGVKLLAITLTRDVLSGPVVVQAQGSCEALAYVAAPSDYTPTNWSAQAPAIMRSWQQAESVWGEDDIGGEPQVFLRARLASIDDQTRLRCRGCRHGSSLRKQSRIAGAR